MKSATRRTRSGTITKMEVLKHQDTSIVHQFWLSEDQTEALTVAVPNWAASDTPRIGQPVLVILHPADSKWPNHAIEVIRDVPKRVADNIDKD